MGIRNKNPQHSSRSNFQVSAQFSAMPGEAHRSSRASSAIVLITCAPINPYSALRK
jgi:hypothetical protein